MEWWQALILGLVEGITEFLPISSTGHLVIASSLLGLDSTPEQKAAVDAFNIVIQGGAILAVLGLYWSRVVQMLRGLVGRDADGRRLLINLIVAFIPAGILGPLLDDRIEERLMSVGPVVGALIVGGVLMIVLDRRHVRPHRQSEGRAEGEAPSDALRASTPEPRTLDLASMTWRQALVIGLLQCVAMWPGTSRSMMTIVGGVLVGLKPRQAAEFSFLLGLPTLGGACLFKLGKNLWRASQGQGPSMVDMLGVLPIVVGLVAATASAWVAVKWLVAFLGRHGLEPFGWYRIALGALLLALVLIGVVRLH